MTDRPESFEQRMARQRQARERQHAEALAELAALRAEMKEMDARVNAFLNGIRQHLLNGPPRPHR
jgi:hypothetical protein